MPTTIDASARLLVTGASGRLGQLVLQHLLDTLRIDPSRVVAGSRNPSKLQAFTDRGITTCFLDFNDATSVEKAAVGVDRALMISSNDMFNRLPGHEAAVKALVTAGVRHILYTSLHNADHSVAFVAGDHVVTEKLIRESGIPGYTFLRNGVYFEKDFLSIGVAKRTGKWYSASHDGELAGISRSDVALANAMALASDNYDNQIYELSGVVGLTAQEIASHVSKAIGRPVDVVQVTMDQYAERIEEMTGLPTAVAAMMSTYEANIASGLAGPLDNYFKALVGRDPLSYAAWLEENEKVIQRIGV